MNNVNVSTRVREVVLKENNILQFNLPKSTEEYPIIVTDDVVSIIPKKPIFGNIAIMAVYDVSVNNLLMSSSPKDLAPSKTRYYIAACNQGDPFQIGDKVVLSNVDYLVYINCENNHRTPDKLKEFISEAYPELTVGTAVALDKDRSRVGLRTEKKVNINPISSSEMDRRIYNNKHKLGSLLENGSDSITIVVYYICPPHAVAVIDQEFIYYDRL